MPRYVLILGSNITGLMVGDRIFTGILVHSYSWLFIVIDGYSWFFSVWHWRSVSGMVEGHTTGVNGSLLFSIQGDES